MKNNQVEKIFYSIKTTILITACMATSIFAQSSLSAMSVSNNNVSITEKADNKKVNSSITIIKILSTQ